VLQLAPLAERWVDHWAWGADAELAVGSETFLYGLALGGRVATGEPATFDVSEWKPRCVSRGPFLVRRACVARSGWEPACW
jgi:hypothetical protein